MLKNLIHRFSYVFISLVMVIIVDHSQAVKQLYMIAREDEENKRLPPLQDSVSVLPLFISHEIFWELDPQSTQAARQVCKYWNWIIGDGRDYLRRLWKKYESKDPNRLKDPQFMRAFLSHTTNINWLHTQFVFWDPQTLSNQQNIQSECIDVFSIAVNKTPSAPHFLCDLYTRLNPCEIHKVEFASRIVKKSTKMQNCLRQILSLFSFDLEAFPELIKNSKTHQSLQKHLMALKLLTLSEDETAQQQMDKFTSDLLTYSRQIKIPQNATLHSLVVEAMESFLDNHHSYLTSFIIWEAYTDDEDTLIKKLELLYLLSFDEGSLGRLNLKTVENFKDYFFVLFPNLSSQNTSFVRLTYSTVFRDILSSIRAYQKKLSTSELQKIY